MGDYLNIIVWSLGIGICLCNFYIYYNKSVLGGFVRALLEKEIFLPESALTLEQLGFEKNRFLKKALNSGSTAVYGVVSEGDEKSTYYIPENKKQKAQKMFSSKGTSLITAIVLSVIVLLATYLVVLALPWIVSTVQNAF